MTDPQIALILSAGAVLGAPFGAIAALVRESRRHPAVRLGWAWCAMCGGLFGAALGFLVAGWLALAVYTVRELSK